MAGTKYSRGSIEGASLLAQEDGNDSITFSVATDWTTCKYLGGTLVGTGFDTGIIFGKTRALVKRKIAEMCEQIKIDIVKGFVPKEA